MAIEDRIAGLLLFGVVIVVFAGFLGAIDPTLSAELNNTAAHPNGPLALTIIGFGVVALAIGFLVSIFKVGKTFVGDTQERTRLE